MSPKLLNILLVLVPLVMYYGFFQPMTTGNPGMIWTPDASISALQSTNVQYLNAINLVSFTERGIKKINDDYKLISSTTTKQVELMLPDSVDPIKLRNEVVSISNFAGVAIDGLSVTQGGKNNIPKTDTYLVTFSVKARYPLLKGLLEEFEKSSRFYNIESITISRNDSKGLTGQDLLLFDKDALVTNVVYKVYSLK